MNNHVVDEITTFLGCKTPTTWLEEAGRRIPDLLVDHAQCEKKAAYSALQLMFRYPEDEELAKTMSRLAREELRHFEQVLKIMQAKDIADRKQKASRYGGELNSIVSKAEPKRLVDTLIVGAFIEARSCERFAGLLPYLEASLAAFYHGLLESEARHYQHYLQLAKNRWAASTVGGSEIEFEERVNRFRSLENNLIVTVDDIFRFHSGPCA